MSRYDLLPQEPIEGHKGYYPVCNKEEWEALPVIYKVMEWKPVKDPYNHGEFRAIKSVIFDVIFTEPYKISAKVEVHPQEIQKILFCLFKEKQCPLYSVCGVELEGGSRVGAKWLQDNVTGAYGIYTCGTYAGMQGGFDGYIPKSCELQEDGSYKYSFRQPEGLIAHYQISNPFER